MFEKLYLLVKNNAGTAVMDNPVIPAQHREAVINEASSSIIEVLKGQIESGKLKDLVKYFQYPGIYNSPVISSIEKKFANRLNKYYNIDSTAAFAVAGALIPVVMQELIKQSKDGAHKEFALSALFSKLNGNRGNMSILMSQAMAY